MASKVAALAILVLAVLLVPLSTAHAQDMETPSAASATETTPTGMPANPDEALKSMSARLDEAAQELRSGMITDERMTHWQNEFGAIRAQASRIAGAADTRVQSIRSLLEALGPPPESGGEPAPVANERGKLNRELEKFVALQKQAELILARVEERRRDLLGTQRMRFTERLLTRGPSIFRPETWAVAGADFIDAVQRATSVFLDAPAQTEITRSWRQALPLDIAVLAIAVILGWPLRTYLMRRYGRDPAVTEPRYMQRLVAAVIEGMLRALVPAVAVGAIYIVLKSQGLLVGLVDTLATSIALAVTFFSLVHGLTKAVLAPNASAWRVIHFTDHCATQLSRMITALAAFFAVDSVFFRLGVAMELTMELAVVHNTVVGLVVAVPVLRMLSPDFWRREATAAPAESAAPSAEESAPPPDEEDEDAATSGDIGQTVGFLLTAAIGLTAIAIPIAAALGYFVLARFLTVRLIISGALVAGLVLTRGLVHEVAGFALHPDTAPGRRISDVLGLSPQGLERLRFWLLIPTDLLLLIGGALLGLALWGVSWDVIGGWISTLVSGAQIGGITISLVDLALAAAVFFIALALSRFIQRVLNQQVFKPIKMDVGVRHSLNAAIGYTGIVLAVLLAIAALGLDLSNLAIIAGALSVGIGFGLQTIVNNFVSGLILLIERPVKVGDWVVVGAYEGFVKKINVRATELETFDRSYVIVPNSEFVSSAVTNWTHRNRQCRRIIQVRVPYGCDTQHVHDLLLSCAREHPDILRWPAPHVLFMDFGEAGLVFELRCYARDVDFFFTAPSELRFAIDQKLRAAGIHVPHPARDIYVRTVPWPEGARHAEPPSGREARGRDPGTAGNGPDPAPSQRRAPPGPAGKEVPDASDTPEGGE